MKIEIKCRFTGSVLFAYEQNDNSLLTTLTAAVKAGADLSRANLDGADLDGADLAGADLAGADLSRANLAGANLAGAYLDGAYLAGANLAGADLSRANLAGANLAGAYLDGAYLDGAYLKDKNKIIGKRPIIQIGGLGSSSRYMIGFRTEKGIYIKTGCFYGSIKEFNAAVITKHKGSEHSIEYGAAITFIKKHFKIWEKK